MHVVIAGGSGFLGRALCEALEAGGRHVTILTRALAPGASREERSGNRPARRLVGWAPDGGTGPWATAVDDADAVVNLAGESIASRRWTAAFKQKLRNSRLHATGSLVSAIRAAPRPPAILLSGSATGYYGPRGDERLTEEAPAGDDFLARLAVDWEQAARQAEAAGVRVVLLRTGIVLARSGGALPRMALPFRLFVGGPVGSGRQYMSWIHLDDWVGMAAWILDTAAASGPINATAPEPVTNREFSKALGRALGRPSFMPAPGFALRLLLGEMADALLLGGQRVVPARATSLGFQFRYTEAGHALRAVFG